MGLRFDPQALYEAVDAERRLRGLSWADLADELHVSRSTIQAMLARGKSYELDGVIAMARWLGRTVESFAGAQGALRPGSFKSDGGFMRFDTAALYQALDRERRLRQLSWDDLAAQVWPDGASSAGRLRRLAKGGRADVACALAACEWLGVKIATFTRFAPS